MKLLFVLGFILTSFVGNAFILEQELWINNGVSNIVDSPEIPYTAFNASDDFELTNVILNIQVGDTINFIIHNNDTLTHGFNISNISLPDGPYLILPGDFIEVEVKFENFGAFIYYDDHNFPHYKALGAAGIIHVNTTEHPVFYWNIKEHDKPWNVSTTSGAFDLVENYDPRYFTINGKSNPETQDDPVSKITGNVGDTLIVCIANTGQMVHSLHLHGYHAVIQYSSINNAHVNREKDTFPIYPMETLIIYLVPDKPGKYPAHDHNLVAVSGNGAYANGMFHIIEIFE